MKPPAPPAFDREVVIGQLRGWLAGQNSQVQPGAITDTVDLIDTRILDSLQLVEFILYLEHLSGRTILVEGLDPSTLRTLASIYDRFFVADPGGVP